MRNPNLASLSTPSWREARWYQIYDQIPLSDVPYHFAGIQASPFLLEYLTEVLRRCPARERTLETGIGSGYGAIWLSQRGCKASGIDLAPELVVRAEHINSLLGGKATFACADLFDLYARTNGESGDAPTGLPYQVIHHQGVLEHFSLTQIRAALAQQVALARWVVFSVPSVHYPFDPEFGDERLLPLGVWEEILSPFSIETLRYYGDPRLGGQEHVLCVLNGKPVTDALRAMMQVPEEQYLPGITGIVQARNESAHIVPCLETLKGWTDEIIVCDMESEDNTVALARTLADKVISHPKIANFDRARNVSALLARHQWIFFLDADERVPPGLAVALRRLVETQPDRRPDGFEALLIPFRHHFAGQWLQCLSPGYTAPRLLRNGRFIWGARPHEGPVVFGRKALFPADDMNLSLAHYSFDSLSHYLTKLNRYTDSEAANMHRDGRPFHWTEAVRHFVHDMYSYYASGAAEKDGVHGFLYSFLSGFYRFEQHAKLYEHRFREGRLQPQERAVPPSVADMLRFALQVAEEEQKPALPAPPQTLPEPQPIALRPAEKGDGALSVVWSGPLHDPSGYGEESRNFLFALEETGIPVAGQSIPWSFSPPALRPEEEERIARLVGQPVVPGFVQVIQDFPVPAQRRRHPAAAVVVGRTMFETDRLPVGWADTINQWDAVWVPSEFNRQTFANAGVAKDKITVIPGCLDPAPYLARAAQRERDRAGKADSGPFTFLSVFDWTRHKGWDVLLRAFAEAFEGRGDARLVFKVWSTMGYPLAEIKRQANDFLRQALGVELSSLPIEFVEGFLPPDKLLDLYAAADAFVLPSRGEGWGRPLMEAMALGLPTIGTNWSGNTAFMTEENSFLIPAEVVPVPRHGYQEIPTYRGHRWAEPDGKRLVEVMRRVVAERCGDAAERGKRAQAEVTERFDRRVVGKQMRRALEELLAAREIHPVLVKPEAVEEQKAQEHISVSFEGAFFSAHSLAHVNREWCRRLLAGGEIELSLVPVEPRQLAPEQLQEGDKLAARVFAPLSAPATVHVRHYFPPKFLPPSSGQFVLVQPWEYGYLPEEWIAPITENVSEVWCYSNFVKDVYIRSGVPAERLQVVPLGVDTSVFHPAAAPFVFTEEPGAQREWDTEGEKPFTFLFVGGTLHRKGIDILLDAYLQAFSAMDNVRLIIKDTGTETVYRGHHARERILPLTADASRPAILYVECDLTPHELAGLYAISDCLVQPYRGEGFCLPALEALACGKPVIVPEGGPTDDFVDETVGWRVKAEQQLFGDGRIGEWWCVQHPWMLEVKPADLARQMRQVAARPEEARKRGQAGLERVQAGWTWEHSTAVVRERLSALAKRPIVEAAKGEPEHLTEISRPIAKRRTAGAGTAKPAPPPALRPVPTISLCMIVKNEERVLGDCLSSIRPFVDEMIVVDTGSMDRTVEIAKEQGAKVFHFPWCDDFSAARNVSLSHATGDWLLWMDADDTISEECGRRLHDLPLLAEEEVAGFIMQVHIPPGPGEHGFTIVDHIKLFRNRPEYRFEGRIHEQILEAISRTGGQIRRSDLYVVHSGYDYSPEGQTKKRARDLTILEKDLSERPNHPFVWFNIGMTAYHLKDFDRAVPALEKCLSLTKPRESIVRKVYAMLTGSFLERNDHISARIWLERGLSLFPKDPELLFRAGILYRELGDLSAAEQAYIKLLTAREVGHLDSLDVSMTGYKAHHNLALLYQDMGRWQEAEREWRTALQHNNAFIPSWLGLADLYLRLGRANEAMAIAAQLEQAAPEAVRGIRQAIGAMGGQLK